MSNYKDLTGKTFGRWTVIELDHIGPGNGAKKAAWWKCQCSCEKHTERVVLGVNLTTGRTKSCGCLQRETSHDVNYKNLVGQTFGRLLVIAQDPSKIVYRKDKNRPVERLYWKCICLNDGNIVSARTDSLTSGSVRSCGCLHHEFVLSGKARLSHGFSKHRLYTIWYNMIDRCYNPSHIAYHLYGARGIKVCDRWLDPINNNGLLNFITDSYTLLGYYDQPDDTPRNELLTIDRKNSESDDYTPTTTYYIPLKEQSRNTRRNRYIKLSTGEKMLFADFKARYGIDVSGHLRTGWSLNAIVFKAEHPDRIIEHDKRYGYYEVLNGEKFFILIPNVGNNND